MRKLIAIAIAAGMAAPAMADTTLYGQLHASVDFLDADGTPSETTVSSNSSRVGIKGSAELNGGLKAIYQAEWGMDTGGKKSGLSDRNQVVGIAGGFGAVLLGRHDTPMKIVGRKADLFWSTQLGQNRNIVNPGAWDLRPDNVIAYQSPKMGGFQALAAYVTDVGGTDDNTAFSVNGIYKAGPMMIGVGYETHDFAPTAASAAVPGTIVTDSGGDTFTLPGTGSPAVAASNNDASAFRLMGSYKFGAAKVVGYYQDEDNAGVDASVWGLGASYKVSSAGTIKGQYYERDNDTGLDPTLVAVGYDHSLGKKTAVYAQYATISDGGKLGGAGHGEDITATTAGGDSDGFSFGIRHKF